MTPAHRDPLPHFAQTPEAPEAPDQSVDLVTPRCARAVPHTRAHVVDVLRAWHCPPELVDDAALLVTELATNAVHHGAGPTLRVRTRRRNRVLRCQVHDSGPGAPLAAPRDATPGSTGPLPTGPTNAGPVTTGPGQVGTPDTLPETGRGLALVDALAARWGTSTDPHLATGSHVTWFELVHPDNPAPPPLPRRSAPPRADPRTRTAQGSAPTPPQVETDPELLRRVLDGLRRL